VLDNDIGDRLSLTEVNDWTVKAGRASIQGDSVVYTPKTGFVGQDSFWYNFVDARGRKNSTQVKVNVTDSANQNEGTQTQGIADAVHIIGFRSLTDFALRNNDVSALNSGKHIMLGDSWFSSEGIYQRLKEKLGNANVINLGIGGNTSAMLLERFDRQVGSQNHDVVWLIVV